MKSTLIPLIISLYLMDISIFLVGNEKYPWLDYIFYCFVILSMILVLVAIIMAIILGKRLKSPGVYKACMIANLVLIPHMILCFVVAIVIMSLGVASIITIFWLASIPTILIGFCVMVFLYFVSLAINSSDIIKLFHQRHDNGYIFTLINVVILFIPVANVIDSVFLFSYFNGKKEIQ